MLKCRLPIIPFSVQTRPFFPVHFALTYPLHVMFSNMPSSVARDSNQYFREVHQGNGGADALQAHMASPGGEVESSKQAPRSMDIGHLLDVQVNQPSAHSSDDELLDIPIPGASQAEVEGKESSDECSAKRMKVSQYPVQVLYDRIDFPAACALGSLKASAKIYTCNEEDLPKETLRTRIGKDLFRAITFSGSDGKFPVLYSESKLNVVVGIPGRLHSSFDVAALAEHHPLMDYLWKAVAKHGNWAATRSIFAGPRWYRQAVRPKNVYDLDRKKSFPSVIAKRHPDLAEVCMYASRPHDFIAACGLDASSKVMDVVKKFCNSCAGSGRKVRDECLAGLGLAMLPQPLQLYFNQIAIAMRRDMRNHPDIVQKLRGAGINNNRELMCKVHYIINTGMERQDMDAVQQALTSKGVEVISLEMDGLAVMGSIAVEDMLSIANSVDTSTTWSWKPYPTLEEILDKLSDENDLDLSLWVEKDNDWLAAFGVEMPVLRNAAALEPQNSQDEARVVC